MSILESPIATGPAVVSRRGVLVGLGGGSLVAGAAAMGAGRVARAAQAGADAMARPDPIEHSQVEVSGYHVTEHIRRYYRTARL